MCTHTVLSVVIERGYKVYFWVYQYKQELKGIFEKSTLWVNAIIINELIRWHIYHDPTTDHCNCMLFVGWYISWILTQFQGRIEHSRPPDISGVGWLEPGLVWGCILQLFQYFTLFKPFYGWINAFFELFMIQIWVDKMIRHAPAQF